MFPHCAKQIKENKKAALLSLPSNLAEELSSVSHAGRGKTSENRLHNHIKTHTRIFTQFNILNRKESVLSPKNKKQCPGTSFLTSFSGSLTVEAAIELPLFFVLIAIVLQYAVLCRAAAQFSGLMTTTAQEMAMAAYKEEYGDANNLIRGVLSDAWASSQVIGGASDRDAVQNASFVNSSYMKDGEMIRLVLSYQAKPRFSLIRLPFTFFVQKAVVRGWTGERGSSGGACPGDGQADPHRQVYVTDTGTVYHTDPECSHLKVTIIPTTKEGLKKARNKSGHKFKQCPHCGRSSGTGQYYIDPYGERWHTSLSCPALKRSVNTVSLDECDHLHECADCKKKRGG